jgi:hypothetical protein
MTRPNGILIEFYPVGAYVKVSAVDPITLTEVSIVGDPAAGEEALTRPPHPRSRTLAALRPPRYQPIMAGH